MLTGVKILIWLVSETTNSCVYVGESSSKGHEAVGKPLSDAEDQSLLKANTAKKYNEVRSCRSITSVHGIETYSARR